MSGEGKLFGSDDLGSRGKNWATSRELEYEICPAGLRKSFAQIEPWAKDGIDYLAWTIARETESAA